MGSLNGAPAMSMNRTPRFGLDLELVAVVVELHHADGFYFLI
jgi:hypothetical protein